MDDQVLKIEKHFNVSPKKLFDFVTQKKNLLKWWGPVGTYVDDNHLDLTKKGAWWFVMVDPNGGRHKVSGEVIEVNAPLSVEFSMSMPGDELCLRFSMVKFVISKSPKGGSDFVMTQTGLSNEEIMFNRTNGWQSTFDRLAKLLN